MRTLIPILFVITYSGAFGQANFDDNYPSWSPSGKEIAFTSNRSGNYEIYVMDNDLKNVRAITNNKANNFWPSWVDDQKIVFDSNLDGNEEIYSISKNGGNLTRLTNNQKAYDAVANTSKSGKILFDSNPDKDELADVWTMASDGTGLKRLTDGDFSFGHGSWSPDEKKVVFKKRSSDSVHELFEMNADGSNSKQLTSLGFISYQPSYSPDGSSVVFASKQDGDFDIYVLDIKTQQIKKLFNNDRPEARATYSPDGKSILFSSKTEQGWRIKIFNIETGIVKE